MNERPYDLIVFGASSFVGQILCRVLTERVGLDGPIRWAVAGRSQTKLEDVVSQTGANVPIITADAMDPAAMSELAASAKVIVSTVGPYAIYGSPLVEAVVAAGTDYCDLTGEVQWMAKMIEAHQDAAERTGARVVHACGFDSIPSDMGVWFLQREAKARFGRTCSRVGLRVKAAKGGISGGTLASLYNLASDGDARRQMGDPYSLNPADFRSGPSQPNVYGPKRDSLSDQWVAPFLMAPVNSAVVQRTHALLGRPWGPNFAYDEAMLMGSGPVGAASSVAVGLGLGAAAAAVAFSPTRRLAQRFGPKPGDGPSPKAQESGFFEIVVYGQTDAGEELQVRVAGDRDPGYGSTARMLAESALCFDASDQAGGFWTPASMFGEALIERLEAHAGLTFEVMS